MKGMLKALPCSIYEDKAIGNCSNDGISAKYDKVLLIMPEGFVDIDPDDIPENAVKLVRRELWGEDHFYIRPVKDCPRGQAGYMAGGCYVSTSDARFRRYCGSQILPLFDRTETWKQYEAYSS